MSRVLKPDDIITNLEKVFLIRKMTVDQISRLLSLCKTRTVKSGEIIIEEGKPNQNLFMVTSGTVEVLKSTQAGETQYTMFQLGPGNLLGEISLVDQQPPSATIVAQGDVDIIEIDSRMLQTEAFKSVYDRIKSDLAKLFSKRLRDTTAQTVYALDAKLKEVKNRLYYGHFMVQLLFIISIYIIAFPAITAFDKATGGFIFIIPLALCISLVAVHTIKKSRRPLSDFGLTLKHWKRNTVEAIGLSVVMLLIVLILKAILIAWSNPSNSSMITPYASFFGSSDKNLGTYLLAMTLYLISTPFQEFISRGALQSTLHHFLSDSKHPRTWTTIVLSNLLFAAVHTYKSLPYALLAFLPGLLWGWLFARQRSLVGVCVSHALFGAISIFVIGFNHLIG